MRKSIVTPDGGTNPRINENWRELERIARVEITSEDPLFPIEHCVGEGGYDGLAHCFDRAAGDLDALRCNR